MNENKEIDTTKYEVIVNATYHENNADILAHLNEYGVFVCDCGKCYHCGTEFQKKTIIKHINICADFIFKDKKS